MHLVFVVMVFLEFVVDIFKIGAGVVVLDGDARWTGGRYAVVLVGTNRGSEVLPQLFEVGQ